MNKIIIIVIAAMLAFSVTSEATNAKKPKIKKAEQKAFNAAVQTSTIASFDAFLAKYPKSILCEDISIKKDSLTVILNTTPYNQDEAYAVFTSSAVLSAEQFSALPYRNEGIDYIYAIAVQPSGICNIYRLSRPVNANGTIYEAANWTTDTFKEEPLCKVNNSIDSFMLKDSLTAISVGADTYLRFSCESAASKSSNREYSAYLLGVDNLNLESLCFAGKAKGDIIEGTLDMLTIDSHTPATTITLASFLTSKPYLQTIAKADLLSDESIEWWYNNNKSGAKTLSFGVLPDECSLIEAFSKQKKENGKLYTAAFFNHRGNTVLCARKKSNGEYVLTWCEPLPAEKKKDAVLSGIYFEGDNNLVLFYYKGNTTFKRRINLATKVIK